MANYTTSASDKKKKTAMIFWAVGLLGLLGLENFYVGKMKAGFIRLGIGLICVMGIYAIITETSTGPVWLIIWAVVSLPNLFKILMGVFKDNVGAPLRG